jgi:hypothetical protein
MEKPYTTEDIALLLREATLSAQASGRLLSVLLDHQVLCSERDAYHAYREKSVPEKLEYIANQLREQYN